MARPFKGTTFWDRAYSQTVFTKTCHFFTGHKDECGYGRINKDGKLVRLHRAIWEDENGSIPEGMVICHRCDIPSCINPDHLFLGTQADNVKDMWQKGRENILRGESNKAAKLKSQEIPKIRQRIKAGDTCYSIAREYKVSGEAILAIKHNRAWVHA